MKLLEYQAKQRFAAAGIAVPEGRLARTPDQAAAVAARVTTLDLANQGTYDLSARVQELGRLTKWLTPEQATQAMQRALKDDQELLILCTTGTETVRVLELFVPAWQLFVLTGIDTEKNITRVISPVESTQLVCKVVKVQAPAQPTRIRFVAPKPKPE